MAVSQTRFLDTQGRRQYGPRDFGELFVQCKHTFLLHIALESASIPRLHFSMLFAERCAMSTSSEDRPPPHALFVKWGKFQAGAFGIPAIITLGIVALSASRLFGWW